MQRLAKKWQRSGVRIGFVPTMGCLHEGHLSLVRVARRHAAKAGKVAVSIYVNPTQFGPKEDLARYPRELQRDLKLCRAEGVDVVFCPSDVEMYAKVGSSRCDDQTARRAVPTTFSTYVVEEKLSQVMEGTARTGHFRGVTTVVAKLFNIVLPNVAVFGAKDFQQVAVVQRMVRDLNFPVQIVIAPTVREPDGVAMSSRNVYLIGELRSQATVLWSAIQAVRQTVATAKEPVPAQTLKARVRQVVKTAFAAQLDYVEFFNPETLLPVAKVSRGTHMALAVFVGNTRLIDNSRL